MKHLKKFENFSNEEIDWRDLGRKLGVVKDPAETLRLILKHPTKSKVYQDWLERDKEIADKYVEFWMDNKDAAYCRWDDVKKKFVDTGISRDGTGLLGTRGYSESKKFRSKVNESFYNEPMTFGSEEHLEFCEQVAKWSNETEQPVHWSLYADPSVSSDPYMRDMTKSAYKPHPLSGDGKRLSQGITHVMTKSNAHTVDKAKTYWDSYIKPGKQFSIVELDGKLIGVIHSNDMVENAFDNMDMKFDLSRAAEALGL